MKLFKNLLSFCLILSIICTTLVFTGGGTALAAGELNPFSSTTHTKIDNISPSDGYMGWNKSVEGYVSYDDALYISFDITPATFTAVDATANDVGYVYLRTNQTSDNGYHTPIMSIHPNGKITLSTSKAWANDAVSYTLPTDKTSHITFRKQYYNFNTRIYLYVNGVNISSSMNSNGTDYIEGSNDVNGHYPLGNHRVYAIRNSSYVTGLNGQLWIKANNNNVSHCDDNYLANLAASSGEIQITSSGEKGCYDFQVKCPEGTRVDELVKSKLAKIGNCTIKLKRGETTTDNFASAGEVKDDDILLVSASDGGLVNEYKIIIPRPIRFTIDSEYEFEDFTKVTATLSDEDVGEVSDANAKLYLDGSDTPLDETADVDDRDVTFTFDRSFKMPLGISTLKIKVTDDSENTFEATKNVNIKLSNPFSFSLPSVASFDNFKKVSAELSSYFEGKTIDAKLYFDDKVQGEPTISGSLLEFKDISPWYGNINVRLELKCDGIPYPTQSADIELKNYKLPDYAATDDSKNNIIVKYHGIWGKSSIDGKNKADYFIENSKGTNFFEEITGSDAATSVIDKFKTQFSTKDAPPGADKNIYRLHTTFKLNEDTGFSVQALFKDVPTISLIEIDTDDGGLSYKVYDMQSGSEDAVIAEGLKPATPYTLDVIINREINTAEFKIDAPIGGSHSINLPTAAKSKDFTEFRFTYRIPSYQGPVCIGDTSLSYGVVADHIADISKSDDNKLSLEMLSKPTIEEGKEIADYIKVTASDGTPIDFYDAKILNNEIQLMSNNISRGETYIVELNPELKLGGKAGTAIKKIITLPFNEFDVKGVDISKSAGKANITAAVQNKELSGKTLTMIVNITENIGGNEVSKAVHIKSFDVPANNTSFNAVFENISCTGSQKVNVFFADGTASFGAISNRVFKE